MERNQAPRTRAFIRRWPKAGGAERLLTAATSAQEAAQLARLSFDSDVTDFLTVLDAEREALSKRDHAGSTPASSAFAASSRFQGFTQQPSGPGNSLPALRQYLMVGGPDVEHLRPNLQPHAYIGETRRAGEGDRVIQQGLRRPHEDRERRDAAQIGENRRR
jgi:hypothetical protein